MQGTTIVILAQDANNKSVAMIRAALAAQVNARIVIAEINSTKLSEQGLRLGSTSQSSMLWQPSVVAFNDIALVIKRTWGSIRTRGLQLCRDVEAKGVPVLNGSDYIEWTHHKIAQYATPALQALFPRSVCFDSAFVAAAAAAEFNYTVTQVMQSIQQQGLYFPLVFKTSQGCRTDGVYKVESEQQLQHLLSSLLVTESVNAEIKHGFLLQELIITNVEDPELSQYYRINLVAGKAQSAMQFQLRWQASSEGDYKKLSEFNGALDTPVDLSFFPSNQLQYLEENCGCPTGVIGIDVLYCHGRLYLLEFNDGPAVSVICDVANKHQAETELSAKAKQQCLDFPNAIAIACNRLLQPQLRAQPTVNFISKL